MPHDLSYAAAAIVLENKLSSSKRKCEKHRENASSRLFFFNFTLFCVSLMKEDKQCTVYSSGTKNFIKMKEMYHQH